MPKIKRKPQNSFIGENAKNKKEITSLQDRLYNQLEVIETAKNELAMKGKELNELKSQLSELSRQIDNSRRKLSHKKCKLKRLSEETNTVTNACSLQQSCRNKNVFTVSNLTAAKRRLNPSHDNLPHKAKCVRRNETFSVCSLIHGGGKGNELPSITGILDTLTSKVKSDDLSAKILKAKPAFVKKMSKKCVDSWSKDYYLSNENILRSLNIYYSKNVMGKRKYLCMRRANCRASFKKSKVPNVVSYQNLSKCFNEIDIGELIGIVPSLSYDLEDIEDVDGMYRKCSEYILRLAKFYLNINIDREDKLKQFEMPKKDKDSFLFLLAFGGDGAPGTGMSFLVSFLNVGQRLVSSSENFLLFGGNVSEDSTIVSRFVQYFVKEMSFLESEVFEIITKNGTFKVEFKLTEIPNDMKMLAFLGGELSNSAKYFSTFANVTQENSNDINKTFGHSVNDYWKPFSYKKRIEDAAKSQQKKIELSRTKTTTATQRNNLTKFISTTLKSRQESVPPIGKYISVAKCEPLHLKNNVVKEFFLKLLKICVGQSDLSDSKYKTFKAIPQDRLFFKFVHFIKTEMHCNFLATKIIRWYNEKCNKTSEEFTFRFRGKESLGYFKHFPPLCSMIIRNLKGDNIKEQVFHIFYCSLLLRKIVSYINRIEDFTSELLHELSQNCTLLFKSCCLFFKKLSPSLWTLCQVSHVHAKETFKLGFGLGCNSMEGREQKHQIISRYSENTTVKNRWSQIFRHEYIHLIYLRENGFDQLKYYKTANKYIPEHKNGHCQNCIMKLDSDECRLCSRPEFTAIVSRVKCS